MQNEWILDVLADLKRFAQQNDLGALADQLHMTHLVAATELASIGEGLPAHERGPAVSAGYDFGGAGKRL